MPSGFVCDKCGQFFPGYSRNAIYGDRLRDDSQRCKTWVFCQECDNFLIRLVESFCEKPELSV